MYSVIECHDRSLYTHNAAFGRKRRYRICITCSVGLKGSPVSLPTGIYTYPYVLVGKKREFLKGEAPYPKRVKIRVE